ncbi:MAG: xylulokinase [Thermodesulfobacteriota bacterium]
MKDGTDKSAYVLAIDLGTSGPKSALVSLDGNILDLSFCDVPTNLLPGGGAEQSPHKWWEAIKSTSLEVLDKNSAARELVTAVCCTGQWSGTVALDKHGNTLMDAIIWLDTRGSPYVQELFKGMLNFQGYSLYKLWNWLRLTGGIPSHSGKDSIAHILYIKHALPEVYENTDVFLEPKDFINFKFTGRPAASHDSITLHWLTDTRKLDRIGYSSCLLKSTGIERSKLPDLKKAVDTLGPIRPEVASELGLKKDVQVIMGTSDVQSAILGSGAVLDFQPHLYIGTSSWLTCHVPEKKTDIFRNMASLPSALPDRYFIANEQETSGACLTFLQNILLHSGRDFDPAGENYGDSCDVLNQWAENAPAGSNGVIFMPWLYGERTPVEDDTLRGGFLNLSLNTTREDMVRAVFEGVACNSRWLLDAVEKFSRRSFDSIHFIGGGAKSVLWGQILADVMNKRVKKVADPKGANIRGTAYLAGLALGAISLEDIPGLVQIDQEFEPDEHNRVLYDKLFKDFLTCYHRTRKIYSKLNKKGN